MSDHGLKEIPEFMRPNLRWLFDIKRCTYVLEHLSPDGLLRWAQVSRPKVWQRCRWEELRKSVRKIHNKEQKWSRGVLEYLQELSKEDLKGSREFQTLYEGISCVHRYYHIS
jgi:hypothetical protein